MTFPFCRRRPLHAHAPTCVAVLVAALSALAGCSQPAAPLPATATNAEAVAIARGRVDIEGGLLSLSPPREGTVAQVAVHEGDRVHAGQLLAALDTEPARFGIDTAQAELVQAQAHVKLLGVQQAAARERARRLHAAVAAGAGDGQSADDASEAATQLDSELQSSRAALELAGRKLKQARYELGLRRLLAPADAIVVRQAIQPGTSVTPGSVLFTLLPDKPRIVRAELNEAFVAQVHPGMPASVSIDGKAKPLAAHVLATLESDPQVRANARTVECVLSFDQPSDLRIGQRVTVRFVGH